jgi:hypothetical protein
VGPSDTTVLRGLDELADRLGDDGLPDRRFTRMLAGVRATAWEQIVAGNHGALPAVRVVGTPLTHPGSAGGGEDADHAPVTVIRLDATIIEAATMKEPSVAGHYKGGIGWHPLTAWCSNTGDHLVVMHGRATPAPSPLPIRWRCWMLRWRRSPPRIAAICW